MIRGLSYSKPLAALAAAALTAASSAAWFRADLRGEIARQREHSVYLEEQLSGKIAAMSAFDDRHLTALRERVGRFRERLGGQGTWERLVSRFGKGWTPGAGPTEDRGAYTIQYGTFRMVSPALNDWPGIVEAVRDSEAMPGVGVVELEMKASGDRERRTLDLVRVMVAIRTGGARPNQGGTK